MKEKVPAGMFVSSIPSDPNGKVQGEPKIITSWKSGLSLGKILDFQKMLYFDLLLTAIASAN